MAAWMLVPINAGPHVLVRVFAGVDTSHMVAVGELELLPDDFADLRARLAPTAAALIDAACAWRRSERSGDELLAAVIRFEKAMLVVPR